MSYLTWQSSNMCCSASSGGPLSCGNLETYCTWTNSTKQFFENSSVVLCESNHSQFAQITSISVIYLYFPTREHLLKAGVSNHQPCQLNLHLGSKATYFLSSASCFVTPVLKFRLFNCGCTWATPMTSLVLHRAAIIDWNLVKDAQGRTESRTPLSWLPNVLNSQQEQKKLQNYISDDKIQKFIFKYAQKHQTNKCQVGSFRSRK